MAEPARPRRRWRELPLVQLTLARYREFYREPEAVFWTFIFPVLMAAGLGLAFRSKPPEVVKVAVVREAPRADSVAAGLSREPALDVRVLDDTAARQALRTGKVALAVRPLATGEVEYIYDETRADAASGRWIVNDALQRAAGRADPVAVRRTLIEERGSRYIDFLVPGLIGMNLMASGIWGIGFSVVDQRRKKLLKRFIATPMSRADYLLSFIVARLTWLVLELALLLGIGAWVFGVPIRGSVAAVAALCLLGALAFGGLGLLIAARPRTIEGASGLMNLVMLPMWVFSGVFFSSSNFPDAMQPFIRALPLTAVNDGLRAVMLEGAALTQLGGKLAVVGIWLVGCFLVALRIFRWK